MEFIAALSFLDDEVLCRKDEEGWGELSPLEMALVD